MNERPSGPVTAWSLTILLILALQPARAIPAQDDDFASSSLGATEILFDENFPTSLFREIQVTDTCKDVEIFAADCCIRDDVVQIIVDDTCLLATIDSRGGADGTHAGETHTVSLPPGTHRIEYRNVLSTVGPSGWSVSETITPFAQGITCRPTGLPSVGFDGYSCGAVSQDTLLAEREDDAGNKYQLYCVDRPTGDEFRLFYVPQGGVRNVTGRCPYGDGFNPHKVLHTGDLDRNGTPDCFVRSSWTSEDLGADDDMDGKLDSRIYVYDVVADLVTRSYYEDAVLFCQDSWSPGPADPPPSPACALDEPGVSGLVALGPGVMTTAVPPACDLNEDGRCDGEDRILFADALSSCAGDPEYHPNADYDLDGCVDDEDELAIFGLFHDGFEIGNPVFTWSSVANGSLAIDTFSSICPFGSCEIGAGTVIDYATSVTGAPELYDYDWSSPDGVFRNVEYSSPVPVRQHTFTTAGCYRPALRIVRGAQSVTRADDNTLGVGQSCPPAPGDLSILKFQAHCPFGFCFFDVGQSISFTTVADGSPTTYQYDWNSPDGVFRNIMQSSSTPISVHVYSIAGNYKPVLRVLNATSSDVQADMNSTTLTVVP